mmetsp:Transcript_51430/g.149541  ORF Transcript_51430/g.149541 Transcript_51430/m.149541 type:complete len:121 (+) Transcript_51430:262-624(+)
MVRNIPIAYTQEMLSQEWPNADSYDFFYLPMSCKGLTNLGYAFINFVSESHAAGFKAMWHGKKLVQIKTKKTLNVSYAFVQGLEANIAALKQKKRRSLRSRKCQPLIINQGWVVPFEDIT